MPAHAPLTRCVVLIPALNPPGHLDELIAALLDHGFPHIVVVDDGSDSREQFQALSGMHQVTTLHHEHNLGKGAALKTGFRYILEQHTDSVDTIVTADADGQHLPGDIAHIAEAASLEKDRLVLGVRQFDRSTPLRSALGNLLTRQVLKWVRGVAVHDSQTGLRGMPLSLARECCAIGHDHYEFELESLLLARDLDVAIREVPIATVYLDGNSDSHFRPLVDSMRIYLVFARFVVASVASFALDILLFALFVELSWGIFAATYLARAVSSTFNFLGNKYLVFRSRRSAPIFREAAAYTLLVVLTATASGYLVSWSTSTLAVNVILVKVVVDSLLFLGNFVIQRSLLFQRRPPVEASVPSQGRERNL